MRKKLLSAWPFCSIFSNGIHILWLIKNPHHGSMQDTPRNIHTKFGSNLSSSVKWWLKPIWPLRLGELTSCSKESNPSPGFFFLLRAITLLRSCPKILTHEEFGRTFHKDLIINWMFLSIIDFNYIGISRAITLTRRHLTTLIPASSLL